MARKPITHVVIMDGTLSSLDPAAESNAGLTYKLLCEISGSTRISLTYEEGIQWCTWRSMVDLAAGIGINGQIRRAYGAIASRYHPGDQIFLFGFSRGAYAVRSLAGVIDRIGLLRADHAIERNVQQTFRYYRRGSQSDSAQAFAKRTCHRNVRIRMIGVWDTVKALGIQYPFLWRLAPQPTDFHDLHLGDTIENGFQALARDETRRAYTPVLWKADPDWPGHLEQVWFRGAHSDVGGQVAGFPAARPLSNIPLVWMLDNAARLGLPLPADWKSRFPTDSSAPAYGTKRGLSRFFLFRARRSMCNDPSERLHASVATN